VLSKKDFLIKFKNKSRLKMMFIYMCL
jgi:hypothetical protein